MLSRSLLSLGLLSLKLLRSHAVRRWSELHDLMRGDRLRLGLARVRLLSRPRWRLVRERVGQLELLLSNLLQLAHRLVLSAALSF